MPGFGYEELLKFPSGGFGIAFNLDEDEIAVVLQGDYSHLHAGDEVERTGSVMDVAVGESLLGRVIDPIGRPLDDKGPLSTGERLPIERPAAPIMDRGPVSVPLQTGLKVIDALIPIGHGQRELILGDRRTGKTAIALNTILNQRGRDVICVYCATWPRSLSCIEQPEFSPVSVPAQIAVLLALTDERFDPVPLDQMAKAERAVHEAATKIPEEICQRFETADKLSDEDREAILDLATAALESFLPKAEQDKPEDEADDKAC